MHYVIQENVFKEHHYDLLFNALDRLGLSYTTVRIFPFVDKIVDLKEITSDSYNVDDLPEFEPKDKNVFVFGAIKLARIAADRKWTPGSLMNENHDYRVYSNYYKENLLNYDSIIAKVGDEFNWEFDQLRFIRPTQDTKAFSGKVFNRYEWREMVEHNLHNYRSAQFNENTPIQVSTPKKIYKEIRFWVVDRKVIAGSQYQLNGKFVLDDQIEEEAIAFAQRMVDIYQLAEAFVIDVCLTDQGWKIVECGCINCAGFYKSDLQKMIMCVDDHFGECKDCISMQGQTGMCHCDHVK
jgi:hypothetical protein